jgi:tetratricopeptide (TPR) repeat protein
MLLIRCIKLTWDETGSMITFRGSSKVEVMFPFKLVRPTITNRSFLSESWQHRIVVAILFLFNCPAVLARDWVRIDSTFATVFTNAGTNTAQRSLQQLETMSTVFREFGRANRSPRLRLMIFATEGEFAAYRPTPISAGFYQSGPEGDWIVFPSGANPRVVLHEYTHMLLNRGTTSLPQWLEEGLAEFFSTMYVSGTKVHFGHAIPEHVGHLRQRGTMRASEMLRLNKKSMHSDAETGTRFYATSWALVHLLYMNPELARHMPEFVDAIDSGSGSPDAIFQSTFGLSMQDALNKVDAQLSLPSLPTGQIEIPDLAAIGGSRATVVEPVQMTEAASLGLQAELLLDSGKKEEAAKRYERIIRSNPESNDALLSSAYLALARNDFTAARRHLEKQVLNRPNPDARAVFEYAMLLREGKAPADREKVSELLRRTVEINPIHPEALFLLGVRATDDGHYEEAVTHLQQAVKVLPRQASFWHALGFVYSKQGKFQAARDAALKSARMADGLEEEQMAKDLLGLTEASQADAARNKPAVHVPPGWNNRSGDTIAFGKLHQFICAADHPRIQVETTAGIEEFQLLQPEKLVLKNASNYQMTFPCGRLEPKSVKIEYYKASGDITSIEFIP